MAEERKPSIHVDAIPFAKGQAVYRVQGAVCENGLLQIALPEAPEGSSFEVLCVPRVLFDPSRTFPYSTTEMLIRHFVPSRLR